MLQTERWDRDRVLVDVGRFLMLMVVKGVTAPLGFSYPPHLMFIRHRFLTPEIHPQHWRVNTMLMQWTDDHQTHTHPTKKKQPHMPNTSQLTHWVYMLTCVVWLWSECSCHQRALPRRSYSSRLSHLSVKTAYQPTVLKTNTRCYSIAFSLSPWRQHQSVSLIA